MEKMVAEIILDAIKIEHGSEKERKILLDKLAIAIKELYETPPLYAQPHESLGVSILSPKSAALAFDKVYRVPILQDPVPEEIGFYGATTPEIIMQSVTQLYFIAAKEKFEIVGSPLNTNSAIQTNNPGNGAANMRLMCKDFPQVFQQSPTIIYSNNNKYLDDFPVGKEEILFRTITDVALVDEDKLSWEQVFEFRKDKESSVKYKRFMRWVDQELLAKPQSQITDEIAIKLDDYNWTLKKHGVETAIGTISSLLDPKFLGTGAVTTVAAGLTAGGPWAALASLSLIVGKAAVTFGSTYIEGKDQSRKENYEIAYINEVKEKLG